ncbi:MAG: molybdopterin molybdotransferase MoeA [Cryobacterium sp.]|nr:molybdopterin molybdotransferase MoeA [Cryobacterium sp.]MBX3090777.1 molybdopterin molybdotransferase MoeA [Cryobacterium sp.]
MKDSVASPRSLSIEEHRNRVLSALEPLEVLEVPLSEALGRTLAGNLPAAVDVPNFDNSAMDGYAVRREDLIGASDAAPVKLRVIEDLPAGTSKTPTVAAGTAARIMTGAPIPVGADSVVPVEDTDRDTESVAVRVAPAPAAHIRRAGTDVRTGELILSAGSLLGARQLSAAAAGGAGTVKVRPAPRVGILSTGSELRPPGSALEFGQIHDSNSTLLAGLVTEAGGEPVLLGSTGDDPSEFGAMIERVTGELDLIVTSGGVSVGAYDVVKAVLAPIGVWFGTVRMQPGKPQGFGLLPNGTPIITLPGNPVSVFVSFEAFVRPALMKLQGRDALLRSAVPAIAAEAWKSIPGRVQFMPVRIQTRSDGRTEVRPASSGGSGSFLVANLAKAQGLALVPEEQLEVREGDEVELWVLQ